LEEAAESRKICVSCDLKASRTRWPPHECLSVGDDTMQYGSPHTIPLVLLLWTYFFYAQKQRKKEKGNCVAVHPAREHDPQWGRERGAASRRVRARAGRGRGGECNRWGFVCGGGGGGVLGGGVAEVLGGGGGGGFGAPTPTLCITGPPYSLPKSLRPPTRPQPRPVGNGASGRPRNR